MAASDKPTSIKEAIAKLEAAKSTETEKFVAAAAEKVNELFISMKEEISMYVLRDGITSSTRMYCVYTVCLSPARTAAAYLDRAPGGLRSRRRRS